MSRGIIATVYAQTVRPVTEEEVFDIFAERYAEEPFVRVLPLGDTATTKNVRLSNWCDLSIHVVNGGNTVEIVSAIDNMVKGAAGQAVQNMNLISGFPETMGIDAIPAAF